MHVHGEFLTYQKYQTVLKSYLVSTLFSDDCRQTMPAQRISIRKKACHIKETLR